MSDILVKVGADITDFSRKMKDSNKALTGFATANKETFDAFKKTGAVVTGFGIAVGAGLGKAVKVAANFEAGMSSVAAISGATGKDLDLLTQSARDWGASTSFSATEAAEGLEYMALAGWDTQQMLGGIGPILHLAEAGALDLGRASDLVTDSMAGLGLEVSDLDGYLDKVAKTASSSNTDIDALMEAFVIAGGTLDRLNVPLEESNALFGVLANRGFKGSEAGTAMNAIMARLTQSTGPAADALKEMGISAYDADGNFRGMETVLMDVEKSMSTMTDKEKAHYQQQLAGLNHGKTFNAMLSGMGDEYHELKGKIEDSDGALLEMRNTMKDNLQGAMENLSSAFEEIAISIGTALLPVVKTLAEWLQKLADWFNGLSDSTKTTIAIVLAVAAALALVVGPILLLIGFIPAIIAGFTALGVVLKAVGAAFLLITSPIGLVVAAVIAAAALIYFYWEPIRDFFIMLWDGIKDAGIVIWEALKTEWAAMVQLFQDIWEGIPEFFSNLWNGIKDIAISIWDGVVAEWDALVQMLIDIWSAITGFFTGLWNSVVAIFRITISTITGAITAGWNAVKNVTSTVFNAVKNTISNIWNGIKNAISSTIDGVKNAVSTGFNFVKNTVSNVMSGVKNGISNAWNSVKSTVTNAVTNIKDTAVDKFNAMKDAIGTAMGKVKSAISTGWDKAKSFLTGINLLSIGKDIISGLVDGIKSKVKAVSDAVKDVASKITGKIKGILGIKSPSRVLAKIGRQTGDGLVVGIGSTQKLVEKAADGLAHAAIPDISMDYATPSGLKSSLSSAVHGTVDVNTREDMLAGAIASLERKLTDLRVEMDGETVGRITRPHVNGGNALDGLGRYFD